MTDQETQGSYTSLIGAVHGAALHRLARRLKVNNLLVEDGAFHSASGTSTRKELRLPFNLSFSGLN